MGLSLDVTRQLYPVAEKLQPRCVHGLFLRCRIVVLSPGFLPPERQERQKAGKACGGNNSPRVPLVLPVQRSGAPGLPSGGRAGVCKQPEFISGVKRSRARASPAVRTVCLAQTGERVTREAELTPPASLQAAGPRGRSRRDSLAASTPHRRASPADRTACLALTGDGVTPEAAEETGADGRGSHSGGGGGETVTPAAESC